MSIAEWHGRYDAVMDTISGDFAFVTQKHLSSCYFVNDLRVNATSMSLSPAHCPQSRWPVTGRATCDSVMQARWLDNLPR